MDEKSPTEKNQADDPLLAWRVHAGDSVEVGKPGSFNLIGFERGSSLLSLPFSSLAYATLTKDAELGGERLEELKLVFSTHVVTLWGQRLGELLKSVSERSVVHVCESLPSAFLLEDTAVLVKELKWRRIEKDADAE